MDILECAWTTTNPGIRLTQDMWSTLGESFLVDGVQASDQYQSAMGMCVGVCVGWAAHPLPPPPTLYPQESSSAPPEAAEAVHV